MLGKQQLADLLAWLQHAPATIKLIASPVLFEDHATTGNDAWQGFRTEREALLGFVAEHGIDNVLLLSGDQHWAGLFTLTRGSPAYTFYEFSPTPLSKSWSPLPTLSGNDVIATFGGAYVYGVVDLDTRSTPARVDLTLCKAGAACHPGAEPPPGNGAAPFTLHLLTGTRGLRPAP
jgi:hypothetical protein